MPLLVVDQNLLNEEPGGVRRRLFEDLELSVVVPDIALVELCKGTAWAAGVEIGLRQLVRFDHRVILSAAVGDTLAQELVNGTPVTRADMLPADVQPALSQLLTSVASGSWNEQDEVRKHVESIRDAVVADFLDAGTIKQVTQSLVQTWRKGLRPGIIRAFASTKTDRATRLAFAQIEAYSLCVRIASKQMGLPQAEAFARAKPMVLRYMLCMVRHTLEILRNGEQSYDKAASWKELNNRLDIDYVLVASYVDGLLSNDKGTKAVHRDLCAMLACPFEGALAVRSDWLRSLGFE